jgi:hypothetical protein
MGNLIAIARLFNTSLDALVGLGHHPDVDGHAGKTPIFTMTYTEDREVIHRRDYTHLNSTADVIMFSLSTLFLLVALALILSAPGLVTEVARGALIVAFVCIILGLMIYPFHVYINTRKRAEAGHKVHLAFYPDELVVRDAGLEPRVIPFGMMDYYVAKKDHAIIYSFRKDRIYVPVETKDSFESFLSGKVERRKRKKPFWA